MFVVNPPGCFPLCVDSRFQADAVRDLEHVSRNVREATRSIPVLGLVLTGSVARGEGTLIADPATGSRWLGDMECSLIVPPGTSAQRIDRILHIVETQLNKDFTEQRRGLKTGLTRMTASQLGRLRTSIFNREFLEHAKLLWGTHRHCRCRYGGSTELGKYPSVTLYACSTIGRYSRSQRA